MTRHSPTTLALGGLLAMAAAMGIGRFVYTPILPAMLEALPWSKADAGLVASANFLGYLLGALAAARPLPAGWRRSAMLAALLVSAATTAAMALAPHLTLAMILRLAGGAASAFVIVLSSTVVLERLARQQRGDLAAVHFAGVGTGIMISAAAVTGMLAVGAGWQALWLGTGALSLLLAGAATVLIPPEAVPASEAPVATSSFRAATSAPPRLLGLVAAYGLFGFGYVITATFIVTIVRTTAEIRQLEPWIWLLFGFAAIPSVAIWTAIGTRIGLQRAFALACLVEAIGVAASVEWVSAAGVCLTAVLLGGTFMGLTALGLVAARRAAGHAPQRAIALMTASFATGQMIGPTVAGYLFEALGSLRVPSLLAAGALVLAAALARGGAARGD